MLYLIVYTYRFILKNTSDRLGKQGLYIVILNYFLCIGVLIDFQEIKFMFLGEKVKQKFDDLKRLT